MDTRKGYKMLVVVLFFAFISLISRSIIYLVLSVAIATMILFLLGSNKNKIKQGRKVEKVVVKEKNKLLQIFMLVIAISGGLILGYGSLFFMEETIFHQYLSLPKQTYIAVLLIVFGFTTVLFSLFFIIKAELGIVSNKGQKKYIDSSIYCGFCGTENNEKHTFCCSCGKQLK